MVGDWETHKDQNGRHFYYNRATQERTWKPPRTRDNSTRNLQGESHSTGESSEVNAIYRSGGSWSIASIGNTFGLRFPEPCALVSRCITLSFNKQWHSLVNKYENITLDSSSPPPISKKPFYGTPLTEWVLSCRHLCACQYHYCISMVVVQKSEDQLSEKNKKLRHENMEWLRAGSQSSHQIRMKSRQYKSMLRNEPILFVLDMETVSNYQIAFNLSWYIYRWYIYLHHFKCLICEMMDNNTF